MLQPWQPVYTFVRRDQAETGPASALGGSSYLKSHSGYHHRVLSGMSFEQSSLMKMINKPRLSVSNNQPPPHIAIITSVPAGQIGTHDNMSAIDDMSAIQTSLAALKDGTTLAVNLPYIAPIASLLLQALTMRDEVKQNKEECEVVMRKLIRVAGIIVGVCGKYNINEEDLPASLLSILGSLQRELDGIERILKDCSRKRGIKGFLLRKDLLTRIKRCDGELSNVLQAFQVCASSPLAPAV